MPLSSCSPTFLTQDPNRPPVLRGLHVSIPRSDGARLPSADHAVRDVGRVGRLSEFEVLEGQRLAEPIEQPLANPQPRSVRSRSSTRPRSRPARPGGSRPLLP